MTQAWAKSMRAKGRLKSAVKVGRVWAVDENEPKPAKLQPQRELPEPKRRVTLYLVKEFEEIRRDGIFEPLKKLNEFATFVQAEAERHYKEAELTALADNAVSALGGSGDGFTRKAVYLYGYKIMARISQSADDAFKEAQAGGKLVDKNLVYILTELGEWHK